MSTPTELRYRHPLPDPAAAVEAVVATLAECEHGRASVRSTLDARRIPALKKLGGRALRAVEITHTAPTAASQVRERVAALRPALQKASAEVSVHLGCHLRGAPPVENRAYCHSLSLGKERGERGVSVKLSWNSGGQGLPRGERAARERRKFWADVFETLGLAIKAEIVDRAGSSCQEPRLRFWPSGKDPVGTNSVFLTPRSVTKSLELFDRALTTLVADVLDVEVTSSAPIRAGKAAEQVSLSGTLVGARPPLLRSWIGRTDSGAICWDISRAANVSLTEGELWLWWWNDRRHYALELYTRYPLPPAHARALAKLGFVNKPARRMAAVTVPAAGGR